jgi:hypothetical protein
MIQVITMQAVARMPPLCPRSVWSGFVIFSFLMRFECKLGKEKRTKNANCIIGYLLCGNPAQNPPPTSSSPPLCNLASLTIPTLDKGKENVEKCRPFRAARLHIRSFNLEPHIRVTTFIAAHD